MLVLPNVKCFIEAQISRVVFAHNNLGINALEVLAGIGKVFLTEEFLLLICSLTWPWMKRVVLTIYC